MPRRRVTFGRTSSVVLLLTFALWVRTQFRQDIVLRANDEGECWAISAGASSIGYLRFSGWPHEQALTWQAGRTHDAALIDVTSFTTRRPFPGVELWDGQGEIRSPLGADPGVYFASDRGLFFHAISTGEASGVRISLWLPMVILGPFVLAVMVRSLLQNVVGRRRTAAGRCAGCGYDLRASGDRCPECGAVNVRAADGAVR